MTFGRPSRFYDRTPDELDHIDVRDDLLSYPEAAIVAGVPETTVRQWKSRHRLHPAAVDEDGRLRFRPLDVLRVEAETRLAKPGRPRKAS